MDLKVGKVQPGNISVGSVRGPNLTVGRAPQQNLTIGRLPQQTLTMGTTASPQNITIPQADYRRVDLRFDPTSNQVVIDAPDYYVNSPEFQNSTLELFKQLEGKQINDLEVKSLMNSDTFKRMQQESNSVKQRWDFVQSVLPRLGPEATEEHAFIYGRNAQAAFLRDDDTDHQMIVGVDAEGNEITDTVQNTLKAYKEMSDEQRANVYKTYTDIMNDNSRSAKQRAAYGGLADFMVNKGLMSAGNLTRINRALDRTQDAIYKGPLGKVGSFFPGVVGGQGDVRAQVAERLEDSNLHLMEGIQTADTVGGLLGEALSLGRDTVLSVASGGTLAPLIIPRRARAAVQTTRAAKALMNAANLTDDAGRLTTSAKLVRGAGSFAGMRAKEAPAELLLSASMAARDPEINTLEEFVKGMALNAVVVGGFGMALRGINRFNPTAYRRGAELTSRVSEKIQSAHNAFISAPGIRRLTTISDGLVDSLNPIRRAINVDRMLHAKGAAKVAREGLETAAGRASESVRAQNVLSNYQDDGRTFVENILTSDGRVLGTNIDGLARETGELLAVETSLDIMKRSDPEYVDDLMQALNDRRIVSNAEVGIGNYSKKEIQRAKESVARFADDPDFNYAWDVLDKFTGKVQDIKVQLGLSDAEWLSYMRENMFKDGFISLSKQVDPSGAWRKNVSPKQIKKIEANYRTRGASGLKMANPFYAQIEEVYAIGKLAANNEVNKLIGRDLVGSGAVGGRIAATPQQTKQLSKMKSVFEGEKASLSKIASSDAKDFGQIIGRRVEDLEDLYSPVAVQEVNTLTESAVDDLVDTILKDKAFDEIISSIKTKLPKTVTNPDYIAGLEVLAHNRRVIENSMTDGLKGVVGESTAGDVMDMVKSSITDKIRLNRAQARGVTIKVTDEMGDPFTRAVETVDDLDPNKAQTRLTDAYNERKKAWKELNDSIGQYDPRSPNTISWYEDGYKGYAEIDDPAILKWANDPSKSQLERGWVRATSEYVSRVFRYGTTGGSPVFNFLRNPIRDSLQALIGVGGDFIRPETTMHMLMKSGLGEDAAENAMRALQRSYEGTSRATFLDPGGSISRDAIRGLRSIEAPSVGQIHRAETMGDKYRLTKAKLDSSWQNLRDTPSLRSGLRDFANSVDSIMNFSEPAVRNRVGVSAYSQAISRGESPEIAEQWAMWAAREVTTNFRNKGKWLKDVGNSIPYLTAAINGTTSFARVAKMDPIGVGMRIMVGSIVPTALITYSNMQDPAMAAEYLDYPEWERRNNLIIMLAPGEPPIKIPIPHEVQPIMNPIVDMIERQFGADKSNFDIIADGLIGVSPFDLSGFAEQKPLGEGGVNSEMGFSRLGGQLLPQILKAPVELLANRSLYTGQKLRMTDEEMIERGLVGPNDDIKASDRSLVGWNSGLLGSIADKIGVDQYILQNMVRNYGGALSEQIIGTLDSFATGTEKQKGGKNFADAMSKAMFGKSYSVAESDYWRGFNELQSKKRTVETKLEKLSQQAYNNPDAEYEVAQQMDALKEEFGAQVAEFTKDYASIYERIGGVDPRKLASLTNLLTFAPRDGSFSPGTWQQGAASDARMAALNEGRELALESGMPTMNPRDMFGRYVYNDEGELEVNYDRTNLATQSIRQRFYDAPKQAAYEFERAMKRNVDNRQKSMNDIWYKEYKPELDKLYEQAKGLKGDAAQAIYSQIHALQEEYMTNEFDPRIQPLLEKWGPSALSNNKVLEAIEKHIQIPGDFTPFFSKKKTPYLKRDVVAYLRDRYGVGNINQSNIPTSPEAEQMINRINTAIDNGNLGEAQFRLDRLQDEIDAGNVYVDLEGMNYIRGLLNRRRR